MPTTPVFDLPYPGPGAPPNVPADIHDLAARVEDVLDENEVTKLTSGVYTPTLTNITNLTSSTSHPLTWMRVGDVLTVDGRIELVPTTAASISVDVSLPVASDLTDATSDVVGIVAGNDASLPGSVTPRVTENRARVSFTPATTGPQFVNLHFMYTVK